MYSAEESKTFIIKKCFVLLRGTLPRALVAYGELLTGIRLIRHFGCCKMKLKLEGF